MLPAVSRGLSYFRRDEEAKERTGEGSKGEDGACETLPPPEMHMASGRTGQDVKQGSTLAVRENESATPDARAMTEDDCKPA